MSKRKNIISAIVIIIICILTVSIFVYYKNSKEKNMQTDPKSSFVAQQTVSEKQFDENNIGELYYSPIDEEHIAEDESGVMYSDNEILLVSNYGVSKSDIEALAEKYGAEIVGWIEQTGDYQLKFSEAYTLEELDMLAEDIQNEDIVYSAYTNYICDIGIDGVDYNINSGNKWTADPLAETSKYFQDTKAWGVQTINAPFAWTFMNVNKENINPVKVGLIDNVFDDDHEDLGFAEVFYNDSSKANNFNGKYHGTHVAGTMAAKGSNDIGICGVYPYGDGNLYAVSIDGIRNYKENNVNSAKEDGETYRILSIMELKIGYAELILRNVKVINVSLCFTWREIYKSKFIAMDIYDYNKIKELYESDLSVWVDMSNTLGDFLERTIKLGYDFVIVSAAGNDSDNSIGHLESRYSSWNNMISENAYPEVYDRIIVVGSIDEWFNVTENEEGISNFSNAGNRVDIFAPGDTIYSTMPGDKYRNTDNELSSISGTSMAAPHVAGVCADVWSMNKYLTGADVKEIVCSSTLDNVVAYTTPSGENRGVVDANKAVAEAYNRLATSGRVIKEPKNGAILGWVVEKDNEDEKIKKADVTAVSESGNSEEYTAETDEYGHFELILPKGDYTITVKAKGYKDHTFDVKLSNNGEVVYPDWVKMEKKQTEAEKYAQIVMDNEDVWLNDIKSLNGYGTRVDCWFQDLDLDGIPEFIVGGSLSGAHSACDFLVYKFDSNKMTLLSDISKGEYLSFYNKTNISYGYDGFILKLYKNKKTDEFIYVDSLIDGVYNETYYCYEKRNSDLTAILESQNLGMCTVHYDDSSNANYTYTDKTETIISNDDFINEYDNFFGILIPYEINVKPIYCYNPDDKEYYFENLNKSEKQKLLIDSFDAFSYDKDDSTKKPLEDFVDELRNIST